MCRGHSNKQCELHREHCGISVCVQCVSSEKHRGHEFVDVEKSFRDRFTGIRDIN